MNLKTAIALTKGGRLRLLWKVTSLFAPFYRLSFVASAASCGLLSFFAHGPRTLDEISAFFGNGASHESMQAWLDLGVRLGELAKDGNVYRLDGFLATKLADPQNDEVAALVQEIVTFHHRLITETPRRWIERRPWTLAEHDGELIARSSRIMEPFVFQTIDWALPASGAMRLLEIGCGSGTYMRYAAERNPELSLVGIDLDEAVAQSTRRSVAEWGMDGRISVEAGDVRTHAPSGPFDVVTMYNSIYYFPMNERVALFAQLASLLAPGGRLILSSSCRGGSPGMQVLDLWTSNAAGLGPLPSEVELENQLREAGFTDVRSKKAIPGEQYYAFVATK